MEKKILRVTVKDIETGHEEIVEIPKGEYLLTCTEPCFLDHVQAFPTTGTYILTIKGRTTR